MRTWSGPPVVGCRRPALAGDESGLVGRGAAAFFGGVVEEVVGFRQDLLIGEAGGDGVALAVQGKGAGVLELLLPAVVGSELAGGAGVK